MPAPGFRVATPVLAFALLAGCSGSRHGGDVPATVAGGAALVDIHFGKLVDVYGFRTVGAGRFLERAYADRLVGPDIQDERGPASGRRDEEVLYDFLSAHPDSLQPRLLIPREIGSPEFEAAVDALDDKLRRVAPGVFGKDVAVSPYSVVPRNAALRLRFSRDLGITDSDLYATDAEGNLTGLKNVQAFQLLEIVSDPTDADPRGDFRTIDTRVVVRGRDVVLDPVLLGSEGKRLGMRNTAAGMPESANQFGANIRIAVATEGPLAVPGIAADQVATLNGRNNDGARSVIRDFRSGNFRDDSPGVARGFLRDPLPPRLIGEMLMFVEQVEVVDDTARLLTIWKGGIEHEIDRGDLLRIAVGNPATTVASLEVLAEPADDLGAPEVEWVRVLVRPVIDAAGEDVLKRIDPSALPGFPAQRGPARMAFLRQHAPRAVLIAEFTGRRPRPGGFYGDDPKNFLSFTPRPLPSDTGVFIANENVSPFAGAIIRFSKPVDMASLNALDTAFFATRDVLSQAAIAEFVKQRDIDPARFHPAKFRTPHLIHSRIFDEVGSQTVIRVQPTMGFYLDGALRQAAAADANKPFASRRFHTFLHLVSGVGGIVDLAGNPLDFQFAAAPGEDVTDALVLPFSIDARYRPNSTEGRFEDNLVVTVARRFAHLDEDERPSLYLDAEVPRKGAPTAPDAWPSADFFGPFAILPTGELRPRPASRVTKIADNLNQQSAPDQNSELRWCPVSTQFGTQTVLNTATTAFGAPIRNPVNPFGCRLQMVWREIDLNLSRTDPLDFNLDVEQMYWAPFAQNPIVFDEFDRMTLYLGHSEFRPENCMARLLPSMAGGGLREVFRDNYAHNIDAQNRRVDRPPPHPAYIDATMTISPKDAILEPNGINRYLPLPKFIDARGGGGGAQNKYFVWRDEQSYAQGGENGLTVAGHSPYPYMLGPFLSGKGRRVVGTGAAPEIVRGAWHNSRDLQLRASRALDTKTGGCVGTIGLPLLADFWTYPDSPDRPIGNPFRAGGVNGWQVSLSVTARSTPNFRMYSAGRGGPSPQPLDPTSADWRRARGGFQPNGARTIPGDNTVYWMMADFIKRTSVVTGGFVDIANPHRMPATGKSVDPRLGPFAAGGRVPAFAYDIDPPASALPPGTAVQVEFRGASALDTPSPLWPTVGSNRNDVTTFPLDPLKAGDAHIRHWDIRRNPGTGVARRWFTHLYNHTVTRYTENPNDLANPAWTNGFSGPYESFNPEDVRYFNWRFILRNNAEVDPPVSPRLRSFAVTYRLSGR